MRHRSQFHLIHLVLCSVMLVACFDYATGQKDTEAKHEPAKTPAAVQGPALKCTVADGFTLAAVGDLIYSEPLAGLADESFQAVVRVLRGADASFGNLENTLIDLGHFAGYPQAESGGAHLIGSPALAKDMRAMGFSLVSRANNHATDWGVEGMRATDEFADAAGLVHAGTGYNRSAARAAHYLQTSKGRVALVSMATIGGGTPLIGPPMSVSADPVGRAPGRPGLNALRLTPFYVVPPDIMQALHKLHDAQPKAALEFEAQDNRALGITEKQNELSLFGVNYRLGSDKEIGYAYEMNERDLRDILKSIRQGKQDSDFLVATIHAHEPLNWSEEPPDFLPKLAHAAIDAGADVFIGHGPHRLKGIEIYNGKPIFYSLGNFFFQQAIQEPAPADVYEALRKEPADVTEHELQSRILERWFKADVWYQSVAAVSRFEHGEVVEVRLYPVDLGLDAGRVNQGIPRQASPMVAKAVLEDLQRLSKPFGTAIEIENGVGVIHPRK